MVPKSHSCVILLIAQIIILVRTNRASFDNTVKPACVKNAKRCHFTLHVEYSLTMVYEKEVGCAGNVIIGRNDNLYKRTPTPNNCSSVEELTAKERNNILYVDGQHRFVYSINKQFPGPSIVVYEGTEVVVKVVNKLHNEMISIHWHGEPMEKTPWMDGVQDITECGIRPREKFTYRFTPKTAGTFWYHAHVGDIRQDGAFGGFIVLENKPDATHVDYLKHISKSNSPEVAKDFILHIHDFFSKPSPVILQEYLLGIDSTPEYENFKECHFHTQTRNGAVTNHGVFHSALINGKGQKYGKRGENLSTHVPKETLMVEENKVYKIRVINSGASYAFELSIDKHTFHVIAMDGRNIVPVEANSVILHPGERVDILLVTSNRPGDYVIRSETLERYDHQMKDMEPNYVHGSLSYSETTKSDEKADTSERTVCTRKNPCDVFNCPSGHYGDDRHNCITLNDIISTPEAQTLIPPSLLSPKATVQEVFLDLNEHHKHSMLNHKRFVCPSSPPLITHHNLDSITKSCRNDSSMDHCTHMMKFELGTMVQFVFTNIAAVSSSHSSHAHSHGHSNGNSHNSDDGSSHGSAHGSSHRSSHSDTHGSAHSSSHEGSHGSTHNSSDGSAHSSSSGSAHSNSHGSAHSNSHGSVHSSSHGSAHSSSHGGAHGAHMMDHPMHIHGYHFTVLKVGFPEYEDNGLIKQQSADIKCMEDSCMHTQWRNDSWKNGNIPGLKFDRLLLRDTVVVPAGGFVVARIKADNPGFWLLHCHTSQHRARGMGMLIQVGERHEMLAPPPGMPKDCGQFDWDGSYDYIEQDMDTVAHGALQNGVSHATSGVTTVILFAISFLDIW